MLTHFKKNNLENLTYLREHPEINKAWMRKFTLYGKKNKILHPIPAQACHIILSLEFHYR